MASLSCYCAGLSVVHYRLRSRQVKLPPSLMWRTTFYRYVYALKPPAAALTALQPYMREAWRVEPRHTYHLGQPLDDLMMSLHQQGSRLLLDLSQDSYSSSSSPSSSSSSRNGSPTSSTSSTDSEDTSGEGVASGISGRGKAKGVGAADGICGHVYPVYAGPSASFAPICTDIQALALGREEGYAAVQKVLLPIKASLQ
jgi:hypothetical protein